MSNLVLLNKTNKKNLKEKFIKDCEYVQKSLENVTDYVLIIADSSGENSFAYNGEIIKLLGLMEYLKFNHLIRGDLE